MKTFSAFIKLYKKPNELSYLLNFLTPVTVVINYLIELLFVKLNVIFFTFYRLALPNVMKDDG